MLCVESITKTSGCIIFGCYLFADSMARTPKSARSANDPALQAPVVEFSPGARDIAGARIFQGIPTIERTANGRLWAAWFARDVDGEGCDHVLMVTSDDDGKT